MVRGHSVVLLPWASRYQLAQPPVVHTVRFIRRWTSSFQYVLRRVGVGSTAA